MAHQLQTQEIEALRAEVAALREKVNVAFMKYDAQEEVIERLQELLREILLDERSRNGWSPLALRIDAALREKS